MKPSQNPSQTGFTLIEIMFIVAIIGLLAVLAVPHFVKARASGQASTCMNNLRQIDGAAQQWAMETKQGNSAVPSEAAVKDYIKLDATGHVPACPAGGAYTYVTMSNPNGVVICSLSTATPAHMLR